MNPEWDLLKVLEAGDWVAAAAYLERLPQRDDAAIAVVYQRIRAAIAQPVLPEADDLQALYEWLQTHHPEDIAHDGPATSE
jgi:hypothetical protein